VNTEERALRGRLREELGALEISPAPVLRVTGRGRGVRARRRAMAAGTVALAALAVVAAARFGGPAHAHPVTLNSPSPAAPGGVFASGTADGKHWTLAVRNIAAAGSHRCVPAVLFNGRDGDVLFKAGPGVPSFGNPALLAQIPGFPGIGVLFTQVTPADSTLAGSSPRGWRIAARAVPVRACGKSFNLAGFAFANPRNAPTQVGTYGRYGLDEGLVLNVGTDANLFGPAAPGIWVNLDKTRADIAATEAATPIGAGTVDGQIWHIRVSLGLYGQCYTATLRTPNDGRGQGSTCVPVAAPPRAVDLVGVPVQSPRIDLPGYAGLVSPRTAYVLASVSNGTIRRVVPVDVDGRAYIALVVPAGCTVTELGLFDAYGHVFATSNGVPAGGQPIPGLPQPHGTAGSS
jgi:hypothetical protein